MTTRPSSRSRRRALGALALTLAGCMGYDYKLNERVVFQGPRLFVDYAIADEHLRACVAQAISDNRITRPEALEDLNCSQAGITSLAGLEVFTGLRFITCPLWRCTRSSRVTTASSMKAGVWGSWLSASE